jgi:pyruvate formate lyase activating enzyme
MAHEPDIRVGGIQALTTVEWEGRLSAVLFLAGCPWRCRYCQNPHLIAPPPSALIPWSEVVRFLDERRGFLDAVVFSGGEPTFQDDLPTATAVVRGLGYEVAVHTNGHSPTALARLLEAGTVDHVALDVKAPFQSYEAVTGIRGSGDLAARSAQIVVSSGIAHEFRTTYHPALLSHHGLVTIARSLRAMGAQAYFLQAYRALGATDRALRDAPQSPGRLPAHVLSDLAALFPRFGLRGFEA